jgi:hypothetical protein
MARSFDDIHQPVPADLTDADAQAYETKVLQLVREGVKDTPEVESVSVRGSRPDTEIVFRMTAPDHAGRREVAYRIWHDAFDDWTTGDLDGPASVAGWAIAAWHANELEAPRFS